LKTENFWDCLNDLFLKTDKKFASNYKDKI